MAISVQGRTILQELLGSLAWAVSGVDDADFDFTAIERTTNNHLIGQFAAGVLDFAPAEFDLAFDADDKCLFAFCLIRGRNIF